MITSVGGRYEDVVAMYPCNNLNAQDMKKHFYHVLKALHEIGFLVVITLVDGNSVNTKFYEDLCGGKLHQASIQ